MNSKLIIIDGIWGSGKTSTLMNLHHILTEAGIENKMLFEHTDEYPINEKTSSDFEILKKTVLNELDIFVNKIEKTNITYLLEGGIISFIVKYAIENNVLWDCTKDFLKEIEFRIAVLNPKIIVTTQHRYRLILYAE